MTHKSRLDKLESQLLKNAGWYKGLKIMERLNSLPDGSEKSADLLIQLFNNGKKSKKIR